MLKQNIRTENRIEGLEEKMDNVLEELIDLKSDVDFVKDFLANQVLTKQDKNEIISHIDGFLKKTISVEQEQTMQTYRIREHTDLLDKHDKEIKKLQMLAPLRRSAA